MGGHCPTNHHEADDERERADSDDRRGMDKYGTTPQLKVRTITVIAELKGTDPALKRIDELETKSDRLKSKKI